VISLIAYIIFLFLKGFSFVINLLPEGVALWLGRQLGRVVFRLDWIHRKVALENLHIAFGEEKPERELFAIARRTFENLGMVAVEFFRIPGMDKETYKKKVEMEGVEEALKVLDKKKGALLLLGHFGNWELMALMSKVIEKPILVIAKSIKQQRIDQWITRIRKMVGLELIPPKNATPKVIKALSQNEVVGILFDQRGKRSKGVWADFFGRKVPTTAGLAIMAIKSGAPVLPVFMIRNGFQKHRLIVKEPLELIYTGDIKKDVEANTQLFNHTLESIIREYPDQWFWVHRRWERKKRVHHR
jgi:KDO2-lipid IV(A) lauroyltransferase